VALVDFTTAKAHLRRTDTATDAEIASKLDMASAFVIKHLKSQAVAGWSTGEVDVPSDIQAATLLVLADLYEQRPVDWTTVERLLVGYRDPALA
jgi:hypothetical protein